MKKEQLIKLATEKTMNSISDSWPLENWPIFSPFYSFKYSNKNGFDRSKIVLVASDFVFTDNREYCYYIQNQQVQSYYIRVMKISDQTTDIVAYAESRKGAKEIIRLIKNNSQFNNPEAIKYSFYNGSGDNKLKWW